MTALRLGIYSVWSVDAYGSDAISPRNSIASDVSLVARQGIERRLAGHSIDTVFLSEPRVSCLFDAARNGGCVGCAVARRRCRGACGRRLRVAARPAFGHRGRACGG